MDYFSEQHQALRQTVRRFADREIRPHIEAWEEEGDIPRALYRKAGERGHRKEDPVGYV